MNQTERVVLIDDNEMDNVYHEFVLKHAGFAGEIVVFNSGERALAGFATLDLDRRTVIMLDINMPGMDGFEVAARLAPLMAAKPGVTLLMLTSSAASEDIAKARKQSVIKGYMIKPLTEDGVKTMLGAVDWEQLHVMLESDRFWP